MKKPRHKVTDHAVLRYLERAHGLDVEAVRRELGARIDAATDGFEGMCGVNIGGLSFRLSAGGTVTTVYDQNRPERSQSGPPRQSETE